MRISDWSSDVCSSDLAEFARLEALNCGKPYHSVLGDEIPAVVDVLRFFAGATRCLHGSAAGEYIQGYTSMIRRDPVGVVASIAPWNYPLLMAAWKTAPAIAGGTCGGLKPPGPNPPPTPHLAARAAA